MSEKNFCHWLLFDPKGSKRIICYFLPNTFQSNFLHHKESDLSLFIYTCLVNIPDRELLSKWHCHRQTCEDGKQKKTMEEKTSIRNVQAFRKFRPGASQPTHCVSLCPHYGASALFVFPLIDWTVIAAEHLWTFAYSPRWCPHLHFSQTMSGIISPLTQTRSIIIGTELLIRTAAGKLQAISQTLGQHSSEK